MNRNNILSIYSHKLSLNRGTPIRVKSLLELCLDSPKFNFHFCSLDEVPVLGEKHFQLLGKKYKDFIKIKNYIKTEKIDLVIFHTLDIAFFVLPLKLFFPKKKFILEMHGFIEEEEYLNKCISLFRKLVNKFIYRFVFVIFDTITTCSETATLLIKKYNSNTTTIYGGVDITKFNPTIKAIDSYKDNDNQIIIGYSGNSRKWQGLDFLLSGFEQILKQDENFKLVLLLSGETNVTPSKKIKLLPEVSHENVASYNAAFDILVIPREQNVVNELSFPSKLMEYMAMGKPIVCSKTSDMHKIIIHGVNGLLFEPGNTENFVKNIMSLKDVALREKISQGAYETVSNNYTWGHQSRLFNRVLHDALI